MKYAFSPKLHVWLSRRLLSGPFIFTIQSLISTSLQILLPVLAANKRCLQTTANPTKPPASPSILTISSWKANLAAAVWRDCQRGFLPGGPCVEQTSAPSASKSAEKFPVERAETFTKSFGSLFLVQCCTWALGHFQSFFF